MFRRFNKWREKQKLKRALIALRNVDFLMIKAGLPKSERKRFWREFVKDREIRDATIGRMEKELGILANDHSNVKELVVDHEQRIRNLEIQLL